MKWEPRGKYFTYNAWKRAVSAKQSDMLQHLALFSYLLYEREREMNKTTALRPGCSVQ